MSKKSRVVSVIELKKGQYTSMVGTTEKVLSGPAKMELTRYGNGAVSSVVMGGNIISREWAAKTKLERVAWDV